MEKFGGMLTSVKCSPHGMELKFDDDGSFAYAQRVWDWVNGADNHTFVMVTGKGDCGPNSKRTPYLVSSITYDEKRNIAHLEAAAGTWNDLAHSYELRVGKIPMTGDLGGLLRREHTKDVYLDLAANLGAKFKVEVGSINGELACDPCYTAGRMHFELVIKSWFRIRHHTVFRLSPEGVKVAANVKFSFTSNFGAKTKLPSYTFPKIPLEALSIPGIFTLGPELEVSIGGEVKAEGTVSVTAGASAVLSDSALLQVDLHNPEKNEFSSWQAEISAEPLQMQAKVSATVKEYLQAFLKLDAEFMGELLTTGA